ncbi:hypothetical protein REPUB_Repub03eG0132200 [Reevesia pubescens]
MDIFSIYFDVELHGKPVFNLDSQSITTDNPEHQRTQKMSCWLPKSVICKRFHDKSVWVQGVYA